MPVELLLESGLLLAVVVTAFTISSIVGMLVARLWATPHQFGGWPDDASPWPARPNPEDNGPTSRPPADSLLR